MSISLADSMTKTTKISRIETKMKKSFQKCHQTKFVDNDRIKAKMMIKDAEDGIVAWEILRRNYSRKTLARTLRNYQVIQNPGQAKINELVGGIAKWEAAVKEVEKEDGKPLPQMVKMAGFTEMCPQDIREKIFEGLNREGETNYEEVRDRIIALVSNRVSAQKGPVPMEIGNIFDEDENEQDIDAVRSSIQCRQCKGWGHMQRECPLSLIHI